MASCDLHHTRVSLSPQPTLPPPPHPLPRTEPTVFHSFSPTQPHPHPPLRSAQTVVSFLHPFTPSHLPFPPPPPCTSPRRKHDSLYLCDLIRLSSFSFSYHCLLARVLCMCIATQEPQFSRSDPRVEGRDCAVFASACISDLLCCWFKKEIKKKISPEEREHREG